jgi:hypothetical protein
VCFKDVGESPHIPVEILPFALVIAYHSINCVVPSNCHYILDQRHRLGENSDRTVIKKTARGSCSTGGEKILQNQSVKGKLRKEDRKAMGPPGKYTRRSFLSTIRPLSPHPVPPTLIPSQCELLPSSTSRPFSSNLDLLFAHLLPIHARHAPWLALPCQVSCRRQQVLFHC